MIVVFDDRHVRGQLGPGRRHRQYGQAGEQQGDREVAPPAGPAGEGFAQQSEARIRDRVPAAPPCRQEVGAEHQRHGEGREAGRRAR